MAFQWSKQSYNYYTFHGIILVAAVKSIDVKNDVFLEGYMSFIVKPV